MKLKEIKKEKDSIVSCPTANLLSYCTILLHNKLIKLVMYDKFSD